MISASWQEYDTTFFVKLDFKHYKFKIQLIIWITGKKNDFDSTVAVSVALTVGVSIGLNFIFFKMFKKINVIMSIIRSSYHGRIFVINLAIAIVDSVETNRWLLHRRVLHKLHPGGQEQLRPSEDREENLRRA